jgi:3-hydroxyacyl-CoA dehydrogenase
MTYRAKKILGMRFALPIGQAQLLEIIRGQETDDATLAAGAEVAQRMGLKIVMIEEARSAAERG